MIELYFKPWYTKVVKQSVNKRPVGLLFYGFFYLVVRKENDHQILYVYYNTRFDAMQYKTLLICKPKLQYLTLYNEFNLTKT